MFLDSNDSTWWNILYKDENIVKRSTVYLGSRNIAKVGKKAKLAAKVKGKIPNPFKKKR